MLLQLIFSRTVRVWNLYLAWPLHERCSPAVQKECFDSRGQESAGVGSRLSAVFHLLMGKTILTFTQQRTVCIVENVSNGVYMKTNTLLLSSIGLF